MLMFKDSHRKVGTGQGSWRQDPQPGGCMTVLKTPKKVLVAAQGKCEVPEARLEKTYCPPHQVR